MGQRLKDFQTSKSKNRRNQYIGSNNNEQLPVLIREEHEFNIQELAEFTTKRSSEFNESQGTVYTKILDAVRSERALCLFISARGGTGKTSWICCPCYRNNRNFFNIITFGANFSFKI